MVGCILYVKIFISNKKVDSGKHIFKKKFNNNLKDIKEGIF